MVRPDITLIKNHRNRSGYHSSYQQILRWYKNYAARWHSELYWILVKKNTTFTLSVDQYIKKIFENCFFLNWYLIHFWPAAIMTRDCCSFIGLFYIGDLVGTTVKVRTDAVLFICSRPANKFLNSHKNNPQNWFKFQDFKKLFCTYHTLDWALNNNFLHFDLVILKWKASVMW